jgi:hypothetical protein
VSTSAVSKSASLAMLSRLLQKLDASVLVYAATFSVSA